MSRRIPFSLALLSFSPLAAQDASFRRADANVDRQVDISDGVRILEILFLGGANPGCDDALDANDSGKVDISDGVYVLNFLFAGGPRPPDPYPLCGADPTADTLGCGVFAPASCTVCLDQAFVDRTVAEEVPAVTCMAPDSGTFVVESIEVTACPAEAAVACPAPGDSPGCPIRIEPPFAVLDVGPRRIAISVTGLTDDFPVRLRDPGQDASVVCLLDMVFSGNGVLPFTVDASGTVTAVGLPIFDQLSAELTEAKHGLLCEALIDLQDRFEPQVVEAIKAEAVEFLAPVRARLLGMKLCP